MIRNEKINSNKNSIIRLNENKSYELKNIMSLDDFKKNSEINEGFFGYDKDVEKAVNDMIAYIKTLIPIDKEVEKWLYNKCSNSPLHIIKWKNNNNPVEDKEIMIQDLSKAFADAKADKYRYSLVYNPYTKGIIYANPEAGINFSRSR